MKCLNCNNDIPDASVVCPFCKSKVDPVVAPTPVFNLEATSSLPVTPSTPVLPQDQGIDVTQNINTVPITGNVSSVSEDIQTPSVNVNPGILNSNLENGGVVSNVASNLNVSSQGENNQGNLQFNGDGVQSSSTSALGEQPVSSASQSQAINVSNNNSQGIVNAINPTYINPDGGIIDGGKIGSSVTPEVKNKNKKKLIIILVFVVVILIIFGLGFAYYYSQYKTADKRVSSVFKGITSMTSNFRNEEIDKASGTYELDLNIDYNDEAMKAKVNGTYARDLSAGALDLTTNIESFVKGEELLNSPINFEVYYNDSKVYVLLENFFDMYIYDEFEGLNKYLESIEQNDINYTNLMTSLKKAINSGLTSMSSTQTVKNVTIHGVSSKVNVVQIRFTARNQSLFINAFCRVLANDTNFIGEMSKLTGKDEDTIKEQINGSAQDKEYQDIDLVVEVYTEMFGEKFSGLKVTKKDEEVNVLELYPITNGYGITYKRGSQNIFEGTYEKTSKRTSTTNETNHKVYFTVYYGDVAYKIDASLNLVGDVNPKDAKVNVKNSINKMYLTEENKAAILEKYNQSGNIALHYPDILNSYLGLNTITNNVLTPEMAQQDACMVVSGCQASNYEGFSICKNVGNADIICQDIWITQGN